MIWAEQNEILDRWVFEAEDQEAKSHYDSEITKDA